MRTLAQKRTTTSGDASAVTYGSQSHSPITWDADMRYSCYPDEYGYVYTTPSAPTTSTLATYHAIPSLLSSAPDLGELSCPYGFDISATDDPPVTEIQRIQCRASSGTFYLSFRNFQSSIISFDTTLTELKTILEAIGSIGEVNVTSSYGDTTICKSASSTKVDIEFFTELSDLPMLVISDNQLTLTSGTATFSIQETRVGSGRYLECSGKGTCNRLTGVCDCFPSWGSSDGRGNQGTRGDCGYNLIY